MKKELRRHIRTSIGAMSQEEKQRQSQAICQQILLSAAWQQAHTVLLYAAMPDEVSLKQLIDEAVKTGKDVILPVVDGEELLLRHYDPRHMAHQGQYQIEEPTSECAPLADLAAIDLALIPGRAFTQQGQRLGRGKGYYDRLLPQLECPKWGVAYSCQMVETIPTDAWDVNMNRVLFPQQ